jgi:glutamine cyclotransferase
MKSSKAQIVREYGPFPGVERVNGVTYDGERVWFASGDKINALDPESGKIDRAINAASGAGTAFDGKHLWQIADDRILKIDPKDGRVMSTIPAPGAGSSGMAWAEGMLWVGEYRARKIHQVDPETGKVIRSVQSDRFVTGVTWMDGELWHATWEADASDIRRVDHKTGEVLEKLDMPPGVGISGMESDGKNTFYCGGAGNPRLRAVRKSA